MKKLAALCLFGTLAFTSCSDSGSELLAAPARASWESASSAWSGFTMIAPLKSNRVHLVDMSGTAVHTWKTAGKPGVGAYLTERGTLLRCMRVEDHPVWDGGGQGGWIQELDYDGSLLWNFRWDSDQGLQHHDLEELPNGNILMITWERHTREEALARGRDPELLAGEEFWPDAIIEIEPTRPVGGKVVWSWHSWDHLVQDSDPSAPNYGKPSDHPERIYINGDRDPEPPTEEQVAADEEEMAALGYAGGDDDEELEEESADAEVDADAEEEESEEDAAEAAKKKRIKNADWMHTNGIDYNAELDQIVLSIRRFDEVWIIDHSTTTEEAETSEGGRSGKGGDLLYRWGNPLAYGMGLGEDRMLFGQHHVQWVEEGQLGAGNLICFNNGSHRPAGEWSNIDEWWPLRDEQGNYARGSHQPWGPRAPEWAYAAPEATDFYSGFISGVQRLPNGNTLICCGAPGWVFEVTPNKQIVWDWKSPYSFEEDEEDDGDLEEFPTSLFRAERYGAQSAGIVALRARGAQIPDEAGAGPATNQYVKPEPEPSDGDADEGEK